MGTAAKRFTAEVLLDQERYGQLKEYQARKGAETLDEAVSLIVNTGLSRQKASDTYQAKKSGERKAEGRARKPKAAASAPKAAAKGKTKVKAKGKTKAKAESKPKAKAEGKSAPKKVSKPAAAAAPKATAAKKVSKSNATIGRIAPQRPGPAPNGPTNSIPQPTTTEVAEA